RPPTAIPVRRVGQSRTRPEGLLMTTARIGLIALGLLGARAFAGDDSPPASLRARVTALRVENVAWRAVPWKSCLLEGLTQSRAEGKPALLWVFIDRPVDDARC